MLRISSVNDLYFFEKLLKAQLRRISENVIVSSVILRKSLEFSHSLDEVVSMHASFLLLVLSWVDDSCFKGDVHGHVLVVSRDHNDIGIRLGGHGNRFANTLSNFIFEANIPYESHVLLEQLFALWSRKALGSFG
jgi:hypothetical protein